jgi:acetyl esterase/lipase
MKDYWEKISPIHSIHKNTPPTVLLLGTRDNVIPVPTAEEYKRRMEALGLRCDVYLYKDQTHGFFNYGKKYYEPTIRDMDRFLVSLGYLETLK